MLEQETPKPAPFDITGRQLIVAYGGGVNSSAFLIEFARRKIIPALILFSDTGGERPETYEFIQTFSQWLQDHGLPAIITVKKGFKKGYPEETLEQNCLRKKMLPSIAYGFKTCSEKFKIRAQEKFVRHYPPTKALLKSGVKLVKVIGYDAGESRRAKPYVHHEYDYWYPLIEWGWEREQCVEVVNSAGFAPAKSSCFFCPSMTKPEILQLRDQHPDLLARALEMEANAEGNLLTVKGLGRRFSWTKFIADVNAGDPKACKWEGDNETPCGCYDG
jgi:hypothetical protein